MKKSQKRDFFSILLGSTLKTIYRYVLKELTPAFLLCVALLTCLFMTNKIFLLLDLVLNKKVPIGDTVILYLSILPLILSMTIPMSMMVGTLLAFGRLSSDMEITAFKSSGIHMFRLIAPVLVLGLLLTGLMIYFNDRILPAANYAYKKTYFKILQRQANIAIREKVWIDKFENYRFLIDRQNRDGTFSNIKAFNKWSPKTPVQTTLAQTGYLETNQKSFQVFFHLNDGVMSWDNANFQTYNRLYFERYIINLKLENQLAHLSDIKKDSQEMTLNEIAQVITMEKDPGRHNYLKTEYQKRLSLPFACLVLAWFCAPLGLWTKSKGFLGFSLGLALIFVYYLMFILGETLSNQGSIDPRLGLWWANLVLAALGGLIYYLVVSEHSAFRGMPPLPRRRSTALRGTP